MLAVVTGLWIIWLLVHNCELGNHSERSGDDKFATISAILIFFVPPYVLFANFNPNCTLLDFPTPVCYFRTYWKSWHIPMFLAFSVSESTAEFNTSFTLNPLLQKVLLDSRFRRLSYWMFTCRHSKELSVCHLYSCTTQISVMHSVQTWFMIVFFILSTFSF